MQLYSFASKYIASPISGVKIPDFDKRIIMAVNEKEAHLHTVVLSKPAKVISEWDARKKEAWFARVVKGINARSN